MADRVSTIFAPANQKYYAPGTSGTPKQDKTRKIAGGIVLGVGFLLTAYFGYLLVSRLTSSSSKPYIYADAYFGKAKVFVNGQEAGETPLEKFIVKKGSNTVKLESGGVSYETSFTTSNGFPSLVKRDLGVDQVFSSGLDLWYQKSESANVLSVVSEPDGAKVFIDGTESGTTPYSNEKLTEGSYDVRVEKSGYETLSERLNIIKGQQLNASFKLFPKPAPDDVKPMEGSASVYDVFSSDPFVTANPQSWAKALLYWNKTRGINMMGFGINRDPVFNYILDFNGIFYDNEGNQVGPENVRVGDGKIAYLRRESDGSGINEPAKSSLEKTGTAPVAGGTAKVKDTPTGWLRVRNSASLSGTEVGRLNVGDIVTVLEEKTDWLKIKTDSGLEGWASSEYLQLQ